MSEQYKFLNPEGLYFTTTTIVNWIDLFTRKDYSEIVLDSLRHCQRQKGLIIHGWNLMPSHLHLIISRRGPSAFHEIFRDFKKHTAIEIIGCMKQINERLTSNIYNYFEKTYSIKLNYYKMLIITSISKVLRIMLNLIF